MDDDDDMTMMTDDDNRDHDNADDELITVHAPANASFLSFALTLQLLFTHPCSVFIVSINIFNILDLC